MIETHPGSGLYDCLSLYDKSRTHIADFNRHGRLHVFHRCDGKKDVSEPMEIWQEMVNDQEPKRVLDMVSVMLGLPIPAHLPKSTPDTLVYRFIAAFLTHAAFGQHRWECHNGFYDTSGYGGGVVTHFAQFPGAHEQLRITSPDDIFGDPAYRFWFVCKDGIATICLETSGWIWLNNGASFHLMALYKQAQRIWPVVTKVARHLLP